MRVLSTILAALIFLLASSIGFYQWDSSRNRGSTFGYYGEFNRTSNALASISGVIVTNAWHNADLWLEEFGFDIMVTGQSVQLVFDETDPIRSMRNEAAVSALRLRIETELTSLNTNQ